VISRRLPDSLSRKADFIRETRFVPGDFLFGTRLRVCNQPDRQTRIPNRSVSRTEEIQVRRLPLSYPKPRVSSKSGLCLSNTSLKKLAPRAGLEPATIRLTEEWSSRQRLALRPRPSRSMSINRGFASGFAGYIWVLMGEGGCWRVTSAHMMHIRDGRPDGAHDASQDHGSCSCRCP
jgi:hypothetical protein